MSNTIPESTVPETGVLSLANLFQMQSELNDFVFKSRDIRDRNGEVLTMDYLHGLAANHSATTAQSDTNTWARNYLQALSTEAREALDETVSKFWSAKPVDLVRLQVEIVDVLHFLISAAIVTGMTPESISEVYRHKHGINIKRQETNYEARENGSQTPT